MDETPAPEEIAKKLGEKVTVSGWVHDVRLLGGISFILVRNSEGMVQVTAPRKAVSKEVMDQVSALHPEDVVRCTGTVKEAKVAKNGFEIIPDKVEVICAAATPLPLDPRGVTDANIDTRLNWRTLDLRRPRSRRSSESRTPSSKGWRLTCARPGSCAYSPRAS